MNLRFLVASVSVLLVMVVFTTSSVSASCSNSEKDAMALCTVAAAKDWNVTTVDMNTVSRKFCCFIWTALDCQVKIARMCDSDYASEIARDTERHYRGHCVLYSRRSPKCVRQPAETVSNSSSTTSSRP